MEIFKEEEKTTNRSTKILLIVNLIIWGIILFMVILWNGVVNAQTQVAADYWAWKDSNNNWTILNNGNTESGANTNQINIGWNNQTGNINGVIYFEAIGTLDNTAKIHVELWTEPTQTSSGVVTKSCTIENYNLVYKKTKCQINFTIANNNQPYIRAAIKLDTNHLFNSITVSGYANVEPNNGATTEDITNQTIQIINNAIQIAQQQIQQNQQGVAEIIAAIGGLEGYHTNYTPDTSDFDDLEDAEDTLHQYTNINLNSFNVDLDTDTNNWVWTTLTSLLNTSSLVFGMVISILSIGLIKLILNR